MTRKPRILVVDEELELLTMTQRLLSQEGFDTSICHQPRLAAATLRDEHFDLLLSEMSLTGISGLELVLWAKKHAPRTQSFLMTPMRMASIQGMLTSAGVQQVFKKPLDMMSLCQDLKSAVRMGVSGKFKYLNILDVLQMLLIDKTNRCISIKDKRLKTEVILILHQGEVQQASVYDSRSQEVLLTGDEAFFSVLNIKNGLFSEIAYPADFTRNIHQPFQSLTMDAAKVLDERATDKAPELNNVEFLLPGHLRRIMVVDDDMLIRVLLKTHLRFQGFEVIEMESALAALQYLQSEKVDLILTDVNMPNMSGLDFILWLKEQPHHCPVIIMTAFPTEEIKQFSQTQRVWRYLQKPIQLEQLSGFLLDLASPGCEGYLENLNTFDFIQLSLLSGGRKLIQLTNTLDDTQGALWLENNAFVHATYGEEVGQNAFQEIVSMGKGQFFEKDWEQPETRSLEGISPHKLLIQATRYLDQKNHFQADDENLDELERKIDKPTA